MISMKYILILLWKSYRLKMQEVKQIGFGMHLKLWKLFLLLIKTEWKADLPVMVISSFLLITI